MHPVAFYLGSVPIYWYGIMIALAFLVGVWTAGRRGLRDGLAPERISDLAVWILVGALIGARTLHVVEYWEEFQGRPLWEIFMIRNGGLVFYGGFIGAAVAAIVFIRWKRLPLFKMADALAPSIALGSAFGRVGCLMTGCCFGRVCTLPWAIHFPMGSLAWEEQQREHLIGPGDATLPVHPTQIYDLLANLLLYGLLAWGYRRKKFDGQIFAIWLVGYAVLRSLVEIFRGDYGEHQFGVFTPAQLVGVAILAAGIALLVWLPRAAARRG